MEAGSAPGLLTSRLTAPLFNGPVPTQSPYDQVREYINYFRDSQSGANTTLGRYESFEGHFSIQIDSIEWSRLCRDLDLDNTETSHQKISYNSSTSTLVIKAMAGASPLHEHIVYAFSAPFPALGSSLPDGNGDIFPSANLGVRDFEGIYQGSQKVPDYIVKFLNSAGVTEGALVVEVGFSETYGDLVQDVRMWLEGHPEVTVVVIVKVNETPEYRCPVGLDDQSLESGEIPDFRVEGGYGPVTHGGSVWVGSISETYVEVWGRDPKSGLISRIRDRIDLHTPANPPNLEFQLSDFVRVTPENDRRITIGWEGYRRRIKLAAMLQADWRYQGVLIRLCKEKKTRAIENRNSR